MSAITPRSRKRLYLLFLECASFIPGCKFTLITDHKPLTSIFGPKKGVPTIAAARLQRWALKLAAYSYEIQFRRTEEHSNADGLSRLPLQHTTPVGHTVEPTVFNMRQIDSLPVTATKLTTATRTDKILSRVYRYVLQSWPQQEDESLSPYQSKKSELTVEGGCVLWGMRVIIPVKLREQLLSESHSSHFGISKMKSIARSYMWWPGLDDNIEKLVKSCADCQAVKKLPHVESLM